MMLLKLLNAEGNSLLLSMNLEYNSLNLITLMVSACSLISRNGTGNVAKVDKPCYPSVKDNEDAGFID